MVIPLALSSLRLRPLRTFLTALGIAVAVGSTVIFLSLGEGLRQLYGSEFSSIGPDIQVSYGTFDATALTSLPELPLTYLAELEAAAADYGIQRLTPILIHIRSGITPNSAFIFQGLPPGEAVESVYYGFEIVSGRALSEADATQKLAVIGEQTSERSRLSVGDTLRLNPQHHFEIVGVARSASGLISNGILVPLESLQRAIGVEDRVSFLTMELAEPARAGEIAERLAVAYPDLGFQTRAELIGVIERGVRIGDVVRLGISAIALIVGAIAVANTVLMSVFERTREFGVVRALGAKPRFLFGLVLLESIILSLVGSAFGIVLGQIGIVIVNRYAQELLGLDVATLTLRLLLFAVFLAIGMGLLSGLLPAARAARIPIAVAMARE